MNAQFNKLSESLVEVISQWELLRKFCIPIAVLAALATAGVQRSIAQTYKVTTLGVNGTSPWAINSGGQICTPLYLWTPIIPNGMTGGLVSLLPLPPSGPKWLSYSQARAVNSSGTVAGYTQFVKPNGLSPKFAYTATIWQNGQPVALPSNGYDSFAHGINNVGDVVGEIKGIATLWHNGLPTSLSTSHSSALGINDTGQIVGISGSHATLWQNGKAYNLGINGEARSINNAGVVTGYVVAFDAAGRTLSHAFLWTPNKANGHVGTVIDLSILPGLEYSDAWSINSSGQVVGGYNLVYELLSLNSSAFIWDSVHGMRDLTSLLPTGSGWTLTAAYGINDSGQIVGMGSNGAFLLTP